MMMRRFKSSDRRWKIGVTNGIVAFWIVVPLLVLCINLDRMKYNDATTTTSLSTTMVQALATPVLSTKPKRSTIVTSSSADIVLTKEQIKSIQMEKEDLLRSVHDNVVFNRLFVNVPERPHPTPYTVSTRENNLDSDGTFPKALLPSNFPPGCLLRLGPNGASSQDGFMDGDGFVNCITFPPSLIQALNASRINTKDCTDTGGTFSSTYIDTRGRKLEVANPGKLFLGTLGAVPYGIPLLQNIVTNAINFRTLQCQKDTCNTALGVHDGKILALMEQCPPCEIQVQRDGRINTVSDSCRLGDAILWSPVTGGALSAHGRTCPITKERIHVSYDGNAQPNIRVDIFQEQFQLKRSIPVNVPCATMVHDCAITNQYVIVLDFPLTLRTTRFLKNQFPVEYEAEYGARIGLLSRNDVDDTNIRWFECEPGIILHTVNAFDDVENQRVIVQALRSEPYGSKGYLEEFTTSYLYEYELDLTSGKVSSERYLNPYEPVEFPNINPKQIGQKSNNAVYCSSLRSMGGPLLNHKQPVSGITLSGITKFTLHDSDTTTNHQYQKGDVVDSFAFPMPWMVVSEPTVVPKTDGPGEFVLLIATKVPTNSEEASESTVIQSEMQTQVVVLDGDHLVDGPIWQCDLPHHVHYGLHSQFLDWDAMV
jgi:carotenoid cleavage dioxygenase-like enzyme